jgi:hypothetical protein
MMDIELPAEATVADARVAFDALGTFGRGEKRLFSNGKLLINNAMPLRDLEASPNRVLYCAA